MASSSSNTINRSWLSYLITIVGAQDLLGLLPPDTHDWRLYITPQELKTLLQSEGFSVKDEDFTGMRPSINPLNFLDGFIPGLLGGFVETGSLDVNYLGSAVRVEK